jgi:hypothetical protein
MLVIGADHVPAVRDADAVLYALIPVAWIVGVILIVALKLRSR